MKDLLSHFQKNNSLYEDVVERIISNFPGNGIYIDGGAHTGRHTATMLNSVRCHRVYAFEPIPSLCTRLEKRFGLDNRFILVDKPLGRRITDVEFSIACDAPGFSGIKRRSLPTNTDWQTISLETVTLDTVIRPEDSKNIKLIKLDLEGGEFDALVGGKDILSSSRPLVVFENSLSHSSTEYSYAKSDFFDFFSNINYCIYDFFGNSVDECYWDATLQTYMFVAAPIESENNRWLCNSLPVFLREASECKNM